VRSRTSAFTFFANKFMRVNTVGQGRTDEPNPALEGDCSAREKSPFFFDPYPVATKSESPPLAKKPIPICRQVRSAPSQAGLPEARVVAVIFRFLTATKITLFQLPATFALGKPSSGRCFALKQAGFKVIRLNNRGKKICEHFVDFSLEWYYNTKDEPECANIPAQRLEMRFAPAERQTVRRVIYD